MNGCGKNVTGDQYKGYFQKEGHGEFVAFVTQQDHQDNQNKINDGAQDLPIQAISVQKTIYDGEWAADMRHGQGKQKFYNQDNNQHHAASEGQMKAEYEGSWIADMFDGMGTLRCFFTQATQKQNHQNTNSASNQISSSYEGTFIDGRRHGQGVLNFACGSLYEGEFQDDHISGYGVFKFANALASYQGTFEKGKFNGAGSLSFSRGNIVYQGEFVKGFLSGNGKLVNLSQQTFYDGLWFKGKMHGEGILYNFEVLTNPAFSKLPSSDQERIKKDTIFKQFQIQGPEIEQIPNQILAPELIPQVRILFRYQGVFKFGQRNGYGKQTTFQYVQDGSGNFAQTQVEGYWFQDALTQIVNCKDAISTGL